MRFSGTHPEESFLAIKQKRKSAEKALFLFLCPRSEQKLFV
jgi:hypothetical protein